MKQEGHIVKSYDEEIKDIKNSIVAVSYTHLTLPTSG